MPTIRQRKDKWQAIVRIKKAGVLVHQESRTFDTERLAKSWAERLEKSIAETGVPARQRNKLTLAELLERYEVARSEVRPLSRSTRLEISQLIAAFQKETCANLSSEIFTTYARKRLAAGAGPVTILHNLATIRAALRAAKPMFNIDLDAKSVSDAIAALQRTGHVSKSNERSRRPTAAELEALALEFRRIAPYPGTIIPMETIVALAVEMPRRLGELCSMTWTDYQGVQQTLRDTKHPRKPRTEIIPVPPKARAIIDALPKIDERILPYKADSVSASFQRACIRLNIQDLHFHDLRHEGISRLFESGLAIQEVAMISGHQSWNMLRRYTQLKPADVLEKMKC